MITYKISNQPKILFVGINPHPGSHRRGVPFSNNKMFWYLLNRAGLLNEIEDDLKNDEYLKRIYDDKFMPEYGLNFVNLVDRPTVDVTELTKGEEAAGVRRALKIIRARKPKVVCFIGKVTYNTFYGCRECDFGWQQEIEKAKTYLMHFPIRGLASIRVEELKEIKRTAELKVPNSDVSRRDDRRSAGLQPAVSPICNRQSVENAGRSAGYKPALQQIKNLRYARALRKIQVKQKPNKPGDRDNP